MFEGFDKPRNPSSEHLMDSAAIHYLKKLPGAVYLKYFLPSFVRSCLNNYARVPQPKHFNWDYKTRQWVLKQIKSEAEAILSYAGKPPDYWKL